MKYGAVIFILSLLFSPAAAQNTDTAAVHSDSTFQKPALTKNLSPADVRINEYILAVSKRKIREEHVCYIAFKNVNVVDAEHNTIKKHRTVIEHDGVISEIKHSLFTFSLKGAKVIDGKGMYLAPALTDMHVHFTCTNRDRLQFLIYGITTIRNMSGSEYHLEDKYYIYANELLSPRLYTAGPPITSGKVAFGHYVPTAAAAKQEVRNQQEAGYDFIKTDKNISDTCFFAVLDEAQRLNMHVAAELPDGVSFPEVLKYGDMLSVEGYERSADSRQFSAKIVASGIWLTPVFVSSSTVKTVKSSKEFLKREEAYIISDKEKALLNPYTIGRYRQNTATAYKNKQRFYKEIYKAGGHFLAGTEAGLPIPMIIPGISLHDELNAEVAAGFTTDQAIISATVNPAKALGLSDETGTVDEGKNADLLLLSENPLENIENYKKISGVMINGVWLSAGDLEEIKKLLHDNE